MSLQGRVESVDREWAGVRLVGDAPAGVVELTVDSCMDLDSDGGSLALADGTVVEYGPLDVYGTSVPLLTPLPMFVDDGEKVRSWPEDVRVRATVSLEDDDGSEALVVDVPAQVAGFATLTGGAVLTFEDHRGRLVAVDVSGDEPGALRSAGVEFTPSDGLKSWGVGPDGEQVQLVDMANGRTMVRSLDAAGGVAGGVGADGSSTATTGYFSQNVVINGRLLLGEGGILDSIPGGYVGGRPSIRNTSKTAGSGSENIYIRRRVQVRPGREYRLVGSINMTVSSATDAPRVRLRRTTDDSTPTIMSTLVKQKTLPSAGTTNHGKDAYVEGFFTVDVPGTIQVAIFGYGIESSATLNNGYLYVQDMGPVDGSSLETAGDDAGMTRYQTTWRATASRMYLTSGAPSVGNDNTIAPDFRIRGDGVDVRNNAAVLFAGTAYETTDISEMGKTIDAALSGGAIVHDVTVYLHNKVWAGDDWSQASGNLTISALNAADLPATLLPEGNRWIADVPAGQAVRASVPVTWFGNGNRGITIGDKDAKALNGAGVLTALDSGVFYGPDDLYPPEVVITYSRPTP